MNIRFNECFIKQTVPIKVIINDKCIIFVQRRYCYETSTNTYTTGKQFKIRMKSNKVKQNYSKYKKVSTNIKGDLLLDDSFLSNQSKDDSLSTDAVRISIISRFHLFLVTSKKEYLVFFSI